MFPEERLPEIASHSLAMSRREQQYLLLGMIVRFGLNCNDGFRERAQMVMESESIAANLAWPAVLEVENE
jgi:hypothetical protein